MFNKSIKGRLIKVGTEFERLTVIKRIIIHSIGPTGRRNVKVRYICQCTCGKILKKKFEGYRLLSGHVKSCGCYKSDQVSEAAKRVHRTHGFTEGGIRPPEYMAWVRMNRRCYNLNCEDYDGYGGRGISVCAEWRYSFPQFFKDMGKRPGKGYCLDRINNDGNYEPSNCRWLTFALSNDNKRTIRQLTIDGVTKTLSQWSKISGRTQETIRSRLRRGWSHKESVFGALKQIMERTGNRWAKR